MSPRPPKVTVIDFESEGIRARPRYPPKPVGFSIKTPADKKSRYYAWGHPTENNCTLKEATRVLKAAWVGEFPLLFQNAKFDVDVAQTHMGMPAYDWRNIHDTLYLLFLQNPHAATHSLKPSAERLLGMKPEEQDAVKEWLLANQDDLRHQGLLPADVKLSQSTSAKPSASGEPQYWAAWICLAPGKLVGTYADGDVIRTELLFKKLWPEIVDRGMQEAYDRERQLMPVLLKNERQGVRADRKLLESDCKLYQDSAALVDAWLRKTLRTKDLNVDSDAELAEALIRTGKADEGLFERTKTGKLSASKDSLLGAVTDRRIMNVLQYRSMLMTRLKTFVLPWQLEATGSGGLVYPNWNQVRQPGGSGAKGARTGRLSASRFMNAPVGVGTSQHDSLATVNYRHPDYVKGISILPAIRKYLLPDPGQLWAKRDYAQQELRILAHFEDNVLLQAFQKNPGLDMHTYATELTEQQFGIKVGRTRMKTIGFSLLYGMGLGELASRLEMEVKEAKQLKEAYLSIFPGLKDLQDTLKGYAKQGIPLRTWGGREYFCEEPRLILGRMRTFEYKMINYLIQGSAADCTKQAIINYDAVAKDGRLLITVHDEIDFSVHKKNLKSEMAILRDAMMDVKFDVMMMSDGKSGPDWANLTTFKED